MTYMALKANPSPWKSTRSLLDRVSRLISSTPFMPFVTSATSQLILLRTPQVDRSLRLNLAKPPSFSRLSRAS
jgi:hypothetical protein